jgi:hypothetical protein
MWHGTFLFPRIYQYQPDSHFGQSHFSPRSTARGGGGGGPPCELASRRWEPTYVASYTHTLGSWVDFFMKFYSR